MVPVSHDPMGSSRRHSRRRPLASHQHREKYAAPAKFPDETEAAKARTLLGFEAFLILTPMNLGGDYPRSYTSNYTLSDTDVSIRNMKSIFLDVIQAVRGIDP